MQTNSKIISRLTALWALTEAGLGGILHAFQFPFTGMFVGGFAVILISLIAYFATHKWETILKSLLVVLIIKVAVSPHSPPTAYLAVAFQAVLGGFIYSRLGLNMWSAMLVGVVALVESALQKLLVLTLIYGTSLWKAVNSFSDWLEKGLPNLADIFSTQALITIYLWIYILVGILLGYLIFDMLKYLEYNKGNVKYQIKAIQFDLKYDVVKRKRGRWKMFVFWAVVVLLIVAYIFLTRDGEAAYKSAIYIVARSLGILLLWYYLLGPYITKWLRKYLEGKKSRVQQEVDETLMLLPYLKNIVELAWKENKRERGYSRWKSFMGDSILYSIHLRLEE